MQPTPLSLRSPPCPTTCALQVCLSLLGTSDGPGWVPGVSTLSQVLLAIQGQIFVEVRACVRACVHAVCACMIRT